MIYSLTTTEAEGRLGFRLFVQWTSPASRPHPQVVHECAGFAHPMQKAPNILQIYSILQIYLSWVRLIDHICTVYYLQCIRTLHALYVCLVYNRLAYNMFTRIFTHSSVCSNFIMPGTFHFHNSSTNSKFQERMSIYEPFFFFYLWFGQWKYEGWHHLNIIFPKRHNIIVDVLRVEVKETPPTPQISLTSWITKGHAIYSKMHSHNYVSPLKSQNIHGGRNQQI